MCVLVLVPVNLSGFLIGQGRQSGRVGGGERGVLSLSLSYTYYFSVSLPLCLSLPLSLHSVSLLDKNKGLLFTMRQLLRCYSLHRIPFLVSGLSSFPSSVG